MRGRMIQLLSVFVLLLLVSCRTAPTTKQYQSALQTFELDSLLESSVRKQDVNIIAQLQRVELSEPDTLGRQSVRAVNWANICVDKKDSVDEKSERRMMKNTVQEVRMRQEAPRRAFSGFPWKLKALFLLSFFLLFLWWMKR